MKITEFRAFSSWLVAGLFSYTIFFSKSLVSKNLFFGGWGMSCGLYPKRWCNSNIQIFLFLRELNLHSSYICILRWNKKTSFLTMTWLWEVKKFNNFILHFNLLKNRNKTLNSLLTSLYHNNTSTNNAWGWEMFQWLRTLALL